MSSRVPNQSPRVKIASLKVLEDEKSQRKLKKKTSSRALLNQTNPAKSRAGDSLDQASMVSVKSAASVKQPKAVRANGNGKAPNNESVNGNARSPVIKVLPEESNVTQLLKAMNGQDVLQLQVQLAKAMDDTSLLRSRLRSELENRQLLESKVTDLTEKLSDAKRGLSDTKSALNKVQAVASQLISKRDEREVQLQTALDQNGIYERKIAELEMHISHLSQINATAAQTSSSITEKILNEHVERNKQLDDELNQVRSQLAAMKRENMRLTEEKTDLEYMLESKKKRITVLEEHVKANEVQIPSDMLASTRESFLMQMLDMSRNNTANGTNPSNNILRQSFAPMDVNMEQIQRKVADMSVMETKLSSLEGDKKALEDRLLGLERQLLEQQKASLAQQQKLFEAQQAAMILQQQQAARPSSSQLQQQGNRNAAQPILNDADAQQLVREILTSRDGGARRPRTQPQPTDNDANNIIASPPMESPNSRNTARNANGRASRIIASPAAQMTRQSSSIERDKEAMTTLPVTTQTVTFAPLPEPSNGDVMRAIESTVRAYDSGALDGKTFESNTANSISSFDGGDDGNSSIRMIIISPRQDSENPEAYRRRLMEEKKQLKKEILEWSKSFERQNGREPTRTEREMHAGSMYKRYRQKSRLLKELDGDGSSGLGSVKMSYNASQQSIGTIQEDLE